jgi:predicted nucleic acid-binding protein
VKAFLDTSALAKRYIAEPGSEKVLALCQQADSLVVSIICLPELISALARLVREKKLAMANYRKLKRDAIADLADAYICQITPEVIDLGISLLEQHSLRAMDALHLASALASEPDIFVSADHRQHLAARKAGLKILDVA